MSYIYNVEVHVYNGGEKNKHPHTLIKYFHYLYSYMYSYYLSMRKDQCSHAGLHPQLPFFLFRRHTPLSVIYNDRQKHKEVINGDLCKLSLPITSLYIQVHLSYVNWLGREHVHVHVHVAMYTEMYMYMY